MDVVVNLITRPGQSPYRNRVRPGAAGRYPWHGQGRCRWRRMAGTVVSYAVMGGGGGGKRGGGGGGEAVTPLLCYSVTPLLRYSVTPLLRYSVTLLLRYSVTPLLHSYYCSSSVDTYHRQYGTLILADIFDNAAMQGGHVSHLTENFTLTTCINSARIRHRQMQMVAIPQRTLLHNIALI